MTIKSTATRLFGIFIGISVCSVVECRADYLLGIQDRVHLRVFDLRKNTGEAHEWTALNGEFEIGAAGNVSLPIIGDVKAENISPSDLALSVSRLLKEKADLAELPVASVEVSKYRPFYIIGAVQEAGKYDYQPNMTVLQAVGLARGYIRAVDMPAQRRTLASYQGELKQNEIDEVNLKIRKSRLEAEAADKDEFQSAPQDNGRDKSSIFDSTLVRERMVFKARRAALKSEIAAINQSKSVISDEITNFQRKIESIDKQIELSKKDLDLVSGLVARGLTVSPRQLSAEQTRTSYESAKIDAQVALLRAQQDLSRGTRDILELQNRYRATVLQELAEVSKKIEEANERRKTLLFQISNVQDDIFPSLSGESESAIKFSIVRNVGGRYEELKADQSTNVMPGDVVRVVVPQMRRSNGIAEEIE